MKTHRSSYVRDILVLIFSLAVLILAGSGIVRAEDELQGGLLEARLGDELVALPSLKTEMRAHIQGDVATVRLTQVFANPYGQALHARYIFPLPQNAAVFAMRMVSGDRMIEAEIQRKQEARAIFEAAKQRGNQAALMSQHRPNVFTQEVANLLPGMPVRVELEYAHAVEKTGSDYEFHFPMVVGPRYLPASEALPGEGASDVLPAGEPAPLEIGVWSLPASPPVAHPSQTHPRRVDRERVDIQIRLEAGLPIQFVESPSHALDIEHGSRWLRSIALAEVRTLDNRDFILRYRLADDEVSAGVTTSAEDGEGFLSLLVEAPTPEADVSPTPRELVFVLDCSGSMAGVPMDASKRFMRRALARLRPTDYFRIIRFSDSASEWSREPMRADAYNVDQALRYVSWLNGSGGTEMKSGIRAALRPAIPENALRLVVFLTDGYIGNDVEIVRLIQQQRGEARFFSFGVGNAVNRYLLKEMARVGRGAARIVSPDEDAELAADELADRLESPVLTHVEIEWGNAPVEAVFPREIPDLFLGQSLRVMGRYSGSGSFPVQVKGRIAGRPVTLPLEILLSENGEDAPAGALEVLWARAQVEDKMVSFIDPARSEREREELQEDVTQLGLLHRLVTQWTSFVAVARPVVNPGGFGREADVAVPQVEGVSSKAYPASALPAGLQASPQPMPTLLAAKGAFHGSAAPEPASWIALAAMITVSALFLRGGRSRREQEV